MLTYPQNIDSNPINTALIGFGFSGQKFHAPFLKVLPTYAITHVVTSRHHAIEELGASVQILPKEQSVDVFTNSEVELVIISAPNDQHYGLAKQALLHNKHVVIEKPFVLDSKDGKDLINIAQDKGLLLSVYHNRRWDSDFLTVQSLLHSNVLGDVYSFRACYDRYRPIVNTNRWKESNDRGSGTLWDLGAHLMDQTLQLFGWPKTIFAQTMAQRSGAQAIDYFDVFLTYENKLKVHLSSSSVALMPRAKYEILGEKGSFIKNGGDPQEKDLINNVCPLTPGFGQEDSSHHGTLIFDKENKTNRTTYPSQIGAYKAYFMQLAQSIRRGAPLPVTAESALNVIRLIEACEESNKEKKVIYI